MIDQEGNLKISVVIPTFNKCERLSLSLESFLYQTLSPQAFELIVVDDGSTDATKETINYFMNQLPLIYIKQNNKGRSAARNRGILSAASKLILLCDDDLIASPGFIQEHLYHHQMTAHSVVHGRIYNLPYLKFFKNPRTGELYEQGEVVQLDYLKKYLMNSVEADQIEVIHAQSKIALFEKNIECILKEKFIEIEWLACTGGNVSCSKQSLIEEGLFNEKMGKQWGCEDFELGYRLAQKEFKFIYAAKASNYHMAHARMTYKEEMERAVLHFYSLHINPYIAHLPKLLLGEIKDPKAYITYVKKIEGADRNETRRDL